MIRPTHWRHQHGHSKRQAHHNRRRHPDGERYAESASWPAGGDMVRKPYTLRQDDDDFGQAATLVREVMDEDARQRLVDNVVGHLKAGVSDAVLERAFEYWRNIDEDLGRRIERGVTS